MFSPIDLAREDAAILKHFQMFGDSRTRDRKSSADLTHGKAPSREPLNDLPPGRVGQCGENCVEPSLLLLLHPLRFSKRSGRLREGGRFPKPELAGVEPEGFSDLTNAEVEKRISQIAIERDDVARDEAIIELARTRLELELHLAQRTIERDDIARDEALAELDRTNAELKRRLAERTIERDDIARDEALLQLARTNAEL